MERLELKTPIKAPIEICFDLSRSIDLHMLTTSNTKEKAIAGVTSGLIKGGEFVTWRAKHFGLWQELTTKIVEYESPTYFHVVMIKGAFKHFSHKHIFEKDGNNTTMIDKVVIEYPMGLLGLMAGACIIDSYMKNIILERNRIIKELAESGRWKEII